MKHRQNLASHRDSSKGRNLRNAVGAEVFDGLTCGLGPDSPLTPGIVQLLDNIPAQTVAKGTLTTQSGRTLNLSGLARKGITPRFRPSELVPGAWEIEAEVVEFAGLPGKHAHVYDTTASQSIRRQRKKTTVTTLEGYIPETAPISLHPRVVIASRHSQVTTRADGRRFRASQDPHAQIYNGDNRDLIYPSGYPERSVCKLEISTRATPNGPWMLQGHGTGFLAGRRVCVTSGHAAPPTPNAGWMIKVIPAMYAGQSLYGAGFFTYAHSYVAYNTDVGNDMMALGLYDAIGDEAGFFGVKIYNDDWEDMNVWSMCGYHFDRSLITPCLQRGIAVYDADDGDDVRLPNGAEVDSTQLESYADEASGSSGAPLYSWFTSGNLYAVGVHHGRQLINYGFGEDRNSVASGGDMLPAFVEWARSEWP